MLQLDRLLFRCGVCGRKVRDIKLDLSQFDQSMRNLILKDYAAWSFGKRAKLYELLRLTYRYRIVSAGTSYRRVLAFVKKHLPVQTLEGLYVLDLATGTGIIIRTVLKYYRGVGQYYAVDLSEEMLQVARKKTGHQVRFVRADAAALPYGDGFFDIVTCISAINDMPDYEKVLEEIKRVLKPGGSLIMLVALTARNQNSFFSKLMKTSEITHFFNPDEFLHLVQSNQFEITEVDRKGFMGFYALKKCGE